MLILQSLRAIQIIGKSDTHFGSIHCYISLRLTDSLSIDIRLVIDRGFKLYKDPTCLLVLRYTYAT